MNNMLKGFQKLQKEGKKALVCYYPICDPALGDSVEVAKMYFEAGVDVLEIGVPYKDPCLDGKTVKDSMRRALEHHDINDAFNEIARIHEVFPDKMLEIMSYYENLEEMGGLDKFAKRASEVGACAILLPNTPLDKFVETDKEFGKYDIYNLRFAYYNISDEQLIDLKNNAKGFIFCQAVNGATGPQKTVDPQVGKNAAFLKSQGITTPCIGGFGISNPDQVYEMKNMGVDGCVIGSSVLTAILEGKGKEYIASLREALDRE